MKTTFTVIDKLSIATGSCAVDIAADVVRKTCHLQMVFLPLPCIVLHQVRIASGNDIAVDVTQSVEPSNEHVYSGPETETVTGENRWSMNFTATMSSPGKNC